MKTQLQKGAPLRSRTAGWLVGLGAVVCSFASCTEPLAQCEVGDAGASPYAALFTLTGGMPACAAQNPGVIMLGDKVGMEFYNPATANGATYNLNATIVALKLDTVGEKYNQYSTYACAPATCQAVSGANNCGTVADGCGNAALWPAWAPGVVYTAGQLVSNNGDTYVVTTAGTSAGMMGGPTGMGIGPGGTGTGIADGGVTWSYVAAATDCGPCPTGQTCGGGGTPSVCGSGKTCTPTTCELAGATCGPIGDGCGGVLQCGTCTAPSTCGGGGTASACGHPIYFGVEAGSTSSSTSQLLNTGSACTTAADCGTFPNDPAASNNTCTSGACQTTNTPYNLAPNGFANEFPSNNLCTFTPGTGALDVSSGPTPSATLPTDSIQYSWNNMSVYDTSADQGTEFEADLTYTENGCTANYHVIGLWPAVDCTAFDANNNPMPNPDLCNPCSEPDKMRFVGSGISPDYNVACVQIYANNDPFNTPSNDRNPFWCVPTNPRGIPQLNPNPPTCASTE